MLSKKKAQWTPPSIQMLKLNVDAAIDSGKQMAGLGAIIRDSNGNCVAVAVKTSHFWRDVFHAEAEATDWGLQMAEQANLNSLIVQSDRQEVVSWFFALLCT